MRPTLGGATLLCAAVLVAPARGQDTTEIARLKRQIEAITRQLEEMQLGADVVRADTAVWGLGPAASKVYRVPDGVSLGGYGEFLYERFARERQDAQPAARRDQLDAVRAIVYVGYKFTPRLLFNSETEFEHGSTDQAGSVSVEFAYLDFRLWDALGLRAGLLLIPMGFLNELHEPPIFLGTTRPVTEQRIIPTTWRESGFGVFGQVAAFAYRAYVVNGFDAIGSGSSSAAGFSAAGLRGGRQKGSRAVAESFAGVARVDYTDLPGVTLGLSFYVGNSGQGATAPGVPGEAIRARTVMWDAHAEYRSRGFDLRALLAVATVDDVSQINALRGLTGSASVGERLVGWYLQGGFDVLRGVRTGHQLVPYVRYEQVDTQDRVPPGFVPNPLNDQELVAIGAAWKPIPNIVVKADYQIHRNGARTGVNQFNVALGYLF